MYLSYFKSKFRYVNSLKDSFCEIIDTFKNKYDVIIYLLKQNDYLLKFMDNETMIFLFGKKIKKRIFKIFFKNNFLKTNYLFKYKYHNIININNINIFIL